MGKAVDDTIRILGRTVKEFLTPSSNNKSFFPMIDDSDEFLKNNKLIEKQSSLVPALRKKYGDLGGTIRKVALVYKSQGRALEAVSRVTEEYAGDLKDTRVAKSDMTRAEEQATQFLRENTAATRQAARANEAVRMTLVKKRPALFDTAGGLDEVAESARRGAEAAGALGRGMRGALRGFEPDSLSGFLGGLDAGLLKVREGMPTSFQIAAQAVQGFAAAGEKSLERFFGQALRGRIGSAKELLTGFGDHALGVVSKTLAQFANKSFFQPALDVVTGVGKELLSGLGGSIARALKGVGGGLLKLFGLAKGGIVTRPTVAILGEAGPEVVIPLKQLTQILGESLLRATGERTGTAIGGGVTFSAVASEVAAAQAIAAGASPLAVTVGQAFAASLPFMIPALFAEAIFNQGAGIRALGATLFGRGEMEGIIPKTLSVLGFKGFGGKTDPHAAGLANLGRFAARLNEIARFSVGAGLLPASVFSKKLTSDALLNTFGGFSALKAFFERSVPGFRPGEEDARALQFFGKEILDKFLAAELKRLLEEAGADAQGRFITAPSFRLIGEAGPEHVFNVNSRQSVDFFQRGVRPLIREAVQEEMRAASGGGGGRVHVDLRGAFLPDARSVELLYRRLEDFARMRRRYGPAAGGGLLA